ncbi:MAG: hypothetical protein ACI4UK_11300 [Floccifex sp.]
MEKIILVLALLISLLGCTKSSEEVILDENDNNETETVQVKTEDEEESDEVVPENQGTYYKYNNCYTSGSYETIVTGLRIRSNYSISSDIVKSGIEKGHVFNVLSLHSGLEDNQSIWGEVEEGWICLCDKDNTYVSRVINQPISSDKQSMIQEAAQIVSQQHGESSFTCTAVYAGYMEKDKIEEYQIGLLSSTNHAYVVTFHDSTYQSNTEPIASKLSHFFGTASINDYPDSFNNEIYDTTGEVNAAIIYMRQAFYWKVIYENEAPNFE